MRKVIRIDEQKTEDKKPVELTHWLSYSGWRLEPLAPIGYDKIVYLGNDKENGDMFAGYRDGNIFMFKGHLNSGEY